MVIPASAQVYSANIVGYVNYTQTAGSLNIVANPLNNGNNDVSTVFANAASFPGLTVYKRNAAGTGYDQATFDQDLSAWTGPLAIAPGEGFWLSAPAGTQFTTTFVGEVVQNSTNAIPSGLSIKGSIFPQGGKLQTDLGFPGAVGDSVYVWKTTGGGYITSNFDADLGGWDNEPVVTVAQGFWVFNAGAAKNWVKNYTP